MVNKDAFPYKDPFLLSHKLSGGVSSFLVSYTSIIVKGQVN